MTLQVAVRMGVCQGEQMVGAVGGGVDDENELLHMAELGGERTEPDFGNAERMGRQKVTQRGRRRRGGLQVVAGVVAARSDEELARVLVCETEGKFREA